MTEPIRLAGKAKTSPSTLHMDGTSPVTVHVQATTDELRALHNQTVEIALPASPQPDTAPEGPWTVDETDGSICTNGPVWLAVYGAGRGEERLAMARRVAAALNGAPATPAERAVIDAAEAWSDSDAVCQCENTPEGKALLDAVATLIRDEMIGPRPVAGLRSERNRP